MKAHYAQPAGLAEGKNTLWANASDSLAISSAIHRVLPYSVSLRSSTQRGFSASQEQT